MPSNRLIFVGPTRTGTSAVFRALSELPEFAPSIVKETNFYLGEEWASATALDGQFRERDGALLRMESSPLYFVQGSDVAKRIMSHEGRPFVVVMLREPVDRLFSLYHHVVAKRGKGVDYSLREFVEEAQRHQSVPRTATVSDSHERGLAEGHYADLLAQWIEVVGADRIYVMFYESLVQNPDKEFAALFRWLGIPVRREIKFLQTNVGVTVRNMTVHSIAMRLNAMVEPLLNRFNGVRRFAKAVYYFVNRPAGHLVSREEVEQLVGDGYRVVNCGLSDALRRVATGALPSWVRAYG